MSPAPGALTGEAPECEYIGLCPSENALSPDSQKWSGETNRKELSFCVSMSEKSLVGLELILWEGRIPPPLQDPTSCTKSQIDVKKINRRKSNLILAYVREVHIGKFQRQSGKMRYICHFELRIREEGSGFSEERSGFHRAKRTADVL